MANIGVELKRLLTKLGGTPSKYDQTNELIHKITDQVEPGGGGGGGLTPLIHFHYDATTFSYIAESDVPFDDLIADWDSESWCFSSYPLVYATNEYGIASQVEVNSEKIVAYIYRLDTTGGGAKPTLKAESYIWDGSTVEQNLYILFADRF